MKIKDLENVRVVDIEIIVSKELKEFLKENSNFNIEIPDKLYIHPIHIGEQFFITQRYSQLNTSYNLYIFEIPGIWEILGECEVNILQSL